MSIIDERQRSTPHDNPLERHEHRRVEQATNVTPEVVDHVFLVERLAIGAP
jgi:hypothetical protein